jgi:hypothetical protein
MATKVSTNQNAENQLPRRSSSQTENADSNSIHQMSSGGHSGSSLKTSFLRRFNRLSAKTRTKYRNELRRSNSLLDLRTNQNYCSRSESADRTNQNSLLNLANQDAENQNHGTATIQDWIGRRLRSRGTSQVRALSSSDAKNQMPPTHLRSNEAKSGQTTTLPNLNSGCTYVGNTLLKQKPRLRVRNTIPPTQNAQDADNTSQDTVSIEDRLTPDYDPRRGRSSSFTRGITTSGTTSGPATSSINGTSGSELSDMEQVLFRAARLRSRRVRSASNETRGTDRTSQEWLKIFFRIFFFRKLNETKLFKLGVNFIFWSMGCRSISIPPSNVFSKYLLLNQFYFERWVPRNSPRFVALISIDLNSILTP